ncbi:hypothetical protein GIY56_17540 [Paracoccus sp. YIM 132242]|uniref:Uncharacterized protein n=1 Tax=Paracoccus lichenicola TaxID=2665644 RepID=A0A6L6HSB3_9RHOB|nr:hypothetical protein [Paracoccus lichenicola]MTE02096.1 hypothetical protein [Paracoccus lichenicola]
MAVIVFSHTVAVRQGQSDQVSQVDFFRRFFPKFGKKGCLCTGVALGGTVSEGRVSIQQAGFFAGNAAIHRTCRRVDCW